MVTARLLARRWFFYLLVCVVLCALSTAFALFVHVKGAVYYPELIAPALAVVIVTVFVGGDATETWTLQERWARILERAWAIILLDIGVGFVMQSGFAAVQGPDAVVILFGFLTVLLSGMLAYAEPYAALETDTRTLTLVPFAILRSMMLAWVNISRIFALLAIQTAIYTAFRYAEIKTGTSGSFWVDLLVPIVADVPLGALYAVAYLDTVSEERRTLA